MTAYDPDIAALAKRLGLRGLRYRSFVPAPMPESPPAAAVPEVAEEAAPIAATEQDAPASVAPAWQPLPAAAAPAPPQVAPPPQAWQPPPLVATPSPPAVSPAPPPPPAASAAAFPLLGTALALAAQRPLPVPDAVPEAARPFAALRFAVSEPDSTQGL